MLNKNRNNFGGIGSDAEESDGGLISYLGTKIKNILSGEMVS